MPRAGTAGRCAPGIAMLATFLFCSPAFALNPALDINQFAHTSWKLRDGLANAPIRTIAQTPDGYLWLGTEFGLLRFDGVRTTPWQPPPGRRLPSTEIYRLVSGRDGSLWIATSGGLARWKDGELTAIEQLDGQIVQALHEGRDGTIWAGTIAIGAAKVCAVTSSTVQCDGAGRLGNVVVFIHEDSSGSVWAGVVHGLWRWRPGPPQFHAVPDASDGLRTAIDNERGLLIAHRQGLRQLVSGEVRSYALPGLAEPFAVSALLRDRDGALWIGTTQRGLLRVHQGRTDVFGQTDGLSGHRIHALFEDREGSIWIATPGGLDRFRDVAVPTFGARQGVSDVTVAPVLAASDGSIWFGSQGLLHQWRSSSSTVLPTLTVQAGGEPFVNPNSVLQDRRGRIWVVTLTGSGFLENGRYTSIGGVPLASPAHGMTEDAAGHVWVAYQNHGLYQIAPDGIVRNFPWHILGRKDFATALAADPARRGLWIGFHNGDLVHLDRGEIRATYTVKEGLGAGRVNDLRFDRHGALWAATAGGLSRLHDGRVATLTARDGLPCDAVHWDVEDDAGSLWLYMPCGLVRIAIAELDTWAASDHAHVDPPRLLPTSLFDRTDGVTMLAIPYSSPPIVTKSADGRIWYASSAGLSLIDPRRLSFNALPPPVTIEQIVADRTRYEPPAKGLVQLPALTRDLQIDYTALSLVAPEKVQFRYRLDGYDRDWQEAGNRRQAFYTNLPPGDYRFHVIAANNSGVWNEAGASLEFGVAPAYYQTTWFAAVSLGGLGALVWAAHRVRLRMVEKHQREISALNERLMKAQEQERIRIAGELHDGVMQEMLAVTMMLGTAKRRMPADSDAKTTMDKIQAKMVRLGTDLRRVSHDLHPPALQDAGLPAALHTYCEEFRVASGIAVRCEIDEETRDLSRGAALALFRIAQEALGNAAKHAKARQIVVRLNRSATAVSLEVSDDGVGFDRARLGHAGGLGLITMRERAGQLNGTFEFESAPGRGATVRVTIPFR